MIKKDAHLSDKSGFVNAIVCSTHSDVMTNSVPYVQSQSSRKEHISDVKMYPLSEKHVIFFLLLQVNGFMVYSVVLDETVQRYIKKVIVLFQKDMQSS